MKKVFLLMCLLFCCGCEASMEEHEANRISPHSLVVGDEYAAYVDENRKLHILYDVAGVTEGVDLEKEYVGLGRDMSRLVTIDVDGELWVSYPYTVEKVEAQLGELYEDISENGGNMGAGHRNPDIMQEFAKLENVQQIICHYPYDFVAQKEAGRVAGKTRANLCRE